MLSEWDTAVSRTRISPNKSNIHLFASVFYGPVITVKVMSSRSVKLFTPFLGRLRPLRGSSTFVRNCQLPFLLQTKVGWGRGGGGEYCRNDSTKVYMAELGFELAIHESAVRRATDCAMEPSLTL